MRLEFGVLWVWVLGCGPGPEDRPEPDPPSCERFADEDGDGFGDPAVADQVDCDGAPGWVESADDCNDADPDVHPDAVEVCDGADNDCDGLIDDEDAVSDPSTWYADADGDTAGNPDDAVVACVAPVGFVDDSTDCDDGDPDIRPGALEVCSDGIDQDCDGADLERCWPTGSLEFETSASTIVYGELTYDFLGESVAVGDVDGDGDDDLLALGTGIDNSLGGTGELYAWPGPMAGPRYPTVNGLTVSASAGDAFERMHFFDVNDDGGQDLLVACNPCSGSPGVAIWYGPLTGTLDTSDADVVLLGVRTSSQHDDHGLTAIGDANGDGATDLLLGAKYGYRAHLVHGPLPAGTSDATLLPGTTFDIRPTQTGTDPTSTSGGDLDGDGRGDVVLGDPEAARLIERGGAAYVFYAPPAGTLDVSMADARVDGWRRGEGVGAILEPAGDVDGDGREDVWSFGRSVTLLSGGVQGATDTRSADVHIGWPGQQIERVLGERDLDGDGALDVVVADYGSDRVAIAFGPLTGALSLDPAETDFDYYGRGFVGKSLAAGDLTGDGWVDLVAGGTQNDRAGNYNVGVVFVIPGGPAHAAGSGTGTGTGTGGTVPLANLRLTDLTPSQVDLTQSDTRLDFTYQVDNTGAADAPWTELEVGISVDQVLDSGDASVCSFSVPPVPAGGTLSYYWDYCYRQRVAPGSYYLVGRIDSERRVAETDETDNEFAVPITVAP